MAHCVPGRGSLLHAEEGKHSLWKIKTETNTVYLLGSVHVLKAEHYPLAEPLEKAFVDSRTIVFEADMSAMTDPLAQLGLLSKGALPEGETLRCGHRPCAPGGRQWRRSYTRHSSRGGW